MRTCQWYDEQEDETCDSLVEGNTDLCARHNRLLRKQIADEQKAEQRRKALLSKPKKVYKAPNKVSPKREELNKEYKLLADEFKRQNPLCSVRVNQFCTGKTESVHHKRGRGGYLLDVSTFLPCCLSCHSYIEAHPQEAKERGWSESRLAKAEPHKI